MGTTADRATERRETDQKDATAVAAPLKHFLDDAETKLDQWIDLVASKLDTAQVKVHLGLMELGTSWEASQLAFTKQVRKLKAAKHEVKAQAEVLRFEAELAKFEFKDLLADMRLSVARVERQIEDLESKLGQEAKLALARIEKILKQLAKEIND